MDVISLLSNLDWPKLQVLYGLGFLKEDIDQTLLMARKRCSDALHLVQTRCLFSTFLAEFLLSDGQTWQEIDLSRITSHSLNNIKAFSIEIDVTQRLDHMFVLAKLDDNWYIIQSYVNKYYAIVEPVDIVDLLTTIQRWRVNGVNSTEWRKFFHEDMPSNNKAVPHVYIATHIAPNMISKRIKTIVNRVNALLQAQSSFIHQNEYRCIIEPYLS